jgi:hypothetical protein
MKALTERARTRDERAEITAVTDRLGFAATARGLWAAGNLRRVPSEDELVGIERWIASTDVGDMRRLRALEGIELYLVPRDAAPGHVLSSPPLTDHLLPRMVSAIESKARQMRGSGAGWLRFTALTGLWPTTQWGRAPLTEKLPSLAAALAAELGDDLPDGIVVTSAAGLHNGEPDETVVSRRHRRAPRRRAAAWA